MPGSIVAVPRWGKLLEENEQHERGEEVEPRKRKDLGSRSLLSC
jgi:hypothetical protein